jgi:hypothetical protein
MEAEAVKELLTVAQEDWEAEVVKELLTELDVL